ncbi:nuclear pore complex protein Nup98-Nup96-like [Paramacrobiotus metropolitanus]|uniref:nuclear pore complex protein Nup98-Nup96-like n=1 Tax=Paramacrobiotus metropolitanus TaxID=2943436 RepID=UPI0024458E5C|nr:nuclear pore complex protein Nup98-Nup96-like [Paramacrobiotus metropolitanus]
MCDQVSTTDSWTLTSANPFAALSSSHEETPETGVPVFREIVGTTVKFCPVIGSDMLIKEDPDKNVTLMTKNICISMMQEYGEKKSLEELRLEDYEASRKTGTGTNAVEVDFGGFRKPVPPDSETISALSVGTQTDAAPSFLSWPKYEGLFGGSGLFPASMFNANPVGTTVKFAPVTGTDTAMRNAATTNIATKTFCISMMREYGEKKSMEELRLEDYEANRKTGTVTGTPMGMSGQAGGLFGPSPPSLFNSVKASVGTTVKFAPVMGTDTVMKFGLNTNIQTKNFCISMMKEYEEQKSMEELRLEDYQANRKTGSASAPSVGINIQTHQPAASGGNNGSFIFAPSANQTSFVPSSDQHSSGQPAVSESQSANLSFFGSPLGKPAASQPPGTSTSVFGSPSGQPAVTPFFTGSSGATFGTFGSPAQNTTPGTSSGVFTGQPAPAAATGGLFAGGSIFGGSIFGGSVQPPRSQPSSNFGSPAQNRIPFANSSIFTGQPAQAAATGGLFGGSRIFGSSAQPPRSQHSSTFGSSVQNTTPGTNSYAFPGQPAQGAASGGLFCGSNIFGSSVPPPCYQPSSTFGSPAQGTTPGANNGGFTGQPAQAASAGGRFYGDSTFGGQSSNIFGCFAQNTTPARNTFASGSQSTQPPATGGLFSGGSTFGGSAQPGPSSFFGSTAQNTTPRRNSFAFRSQSAQPSAAGWPSNGGSYGFGLGAPVQPPRSQSSSFFGSTAQNTTLGASLFDRPAQPATGGSSNGGSYGFSFGAPVQPPRSQSSSLFGSTAQNTTPAANTSGLFGQPAPPAATAGSSSGGSYGFGFGAPVQPSHSQPSVFSGPTAQNTTGTNTSGLFGQPQQPAATAGFSFGNPNLPGYGSYTAYPPGHVFDQPRAAAAGLPGQAAAAAPLFRINITANAAGNGFVVEFLPN